MALPLSEVQRRSEYEEEKIIEFPLREPPIATVDPSTDALKQFLNNGHERYAKNLVISCLPFVPENNRVEFINAVGRRPESFLEMINSRGKVSIASIILDFLSQDWD